MASPTIRRDLKALHRLINQADLVLNTIPDPHPSIASARESLNAALVLTQDLHKRASVDPIKAGAAELGAKGGTKTAERGPEYFARIAAMRKNRKGGRPKKNPHSEG
jgi:hypothetical protein